MKPDETVVGLEGADPDPARHIVSLYQALGDDAAFDDHLDPTITIWESDQPQMLCGLDQLATLRNTSRENPETGTNGSLTVTPGDFVVTRWGEIAVVRSVLRVTSEDGVPQQSFRVTDVLRGGQTGWKIVHHHAELLT